MNLADAFAFIAMVVSMATLAIALVQEDKQLRETIDIANKFAHNNYILQNKLNNQLANMQTIINANLEAVLNTEEEAEKISNQSGKTEIVKLPWKPKLGEQYWYYSINSEIARWTLWYSSGFDLENWKIGNFFETREEALDKGKKIMEAIQKEFEEA